MNFRYADEEMRAVYGTDQSHQCTDCKNRTGREAVKATGGDYCALTNKRRKCSSFGFACGLDKDRKNCAIENLYCTTRKINFMMAKNGWYSSNPEITLTALKWCELFYAIRSENSEQH